MPYPDPDNQWLLAQCLYECKKFEEAQWICPDLILYGQENDIKATALELNGHCLVEMNKYSEGMTNLDQAYELTSSPVDKLRIRFAMYKYAYDAQDAVYCTKLQYLILPPTSYTNFPELLMEKGRIENTVEFVIEKSAQKVKSDPSEDAQNHLMFCNSVMITKKFKKMVTKKFKK